MIACLELYRASGEAQYREGAVAYGQRVLALQVTNAMAGEAPVRGYLRRSLQSAEPERQISNGCLHLLGLCALLETLPEYPQAPHWREAVRRYCGDYLAPLAARNAFGIVPFGLFQGSDPGGNRRLGQYWYRYFMPPEASWVAIPLVPARWCGWAPTTNRLDPTTPLTPGAVMVGKPVILESDDRR